ncbi:unnamed protein product [Moneuplotes crassus]|uniref:Uncharacterized protein n=1 Tax=Euplotes crassus TaxID=5936 RepID=A0AAD2CVJ2_EUPCR|nr:unnamed protein product [Moneuplotes crassus]
MSAAMDIGKANKEKERYNKIRTQKMKAKKGFLTLGYGFVAYFNFLEFIILIFTALTLLSLPSFYFYWNFREVQDENIGWMNKLSMGNLGYSHALCRDVHLGVGKLTLSCSTGVIKDVVSFGIIPENSKTLDACLPTEETEVCSSVLNEDELTEIINHECLDKKLCTLDVSSYVNQTIDQNPVCTGTEARFYTQVFCKALDEEEIEARKSIQFILIWTTIISALLYFIGFEFIDSYAESKLEEYDQITTTTSDFTAIYKIPPALYENFRQNIYPQLNDNMQRTRKKTLAPIMAFKGFLIDGIVRQLSDDDPEGSRPVFSTGEKDHPSFIHGEFNKDIKVNQDAQDNDFFGLDNRRRENLSEIGNHRFVEVEVKMKQDESHNPTPKEAPIMTKKATVKRSTSTRSEKLKLNKKRTEFISRKGSKGNLEDYFSKTKDIEIADIHFSFKNREVLHLLGERGKAILDNNHEMKVLIQNEILTLIKKDYEIYTTPVCAFITFANEESYLRATELNKVRIGNKSYYKKHWQGHPLYFKPALEPSSILWENQYVPQSEKAWKIIISLMVVFLILFASFVFLFYAQKEIYDYMNVYPYIDCDSIVKTYGDSLEHYGVLEWVYLKETLHSKDLTSSTGTLSCFCNQHSLKHGVLATMKSQHYTINKEDVFVGGHICYDWQSGKTLVTFLDIIITLFICFADIILRNIVVILIRWVNFRSMNIESATIQVILFVSQYLNNGLSLMLVGINCDELLGIRIFFLDGRYPDFTNRWFNELSNFFITPMYINIFVPFIEFGILYLIYIIKKRLDKGWTQNIYSTKCKSMGQYINKMSGPTNDIFDGYSYIMVIIWINMYFGVGLPLLFPLTLISAIITYAFEKIKTVYWYKKSSMLNDRLNKNAIKTCKWAVILYCFAGYWFLTNKQIFYDEVTAKSKRSDIVITNHTYGTIEIDQSFPLLMVFFILLAYMIFHSIYSSVSSLIKTDTMNQYLRSVEDLFTYYDSLDQHDLKTLVLEEEHNRSILDYSKLNDNILKKYKLSRSKRLKSFKNLSSMQNEIVDDKTIFNNFTYDLLMDTRYIDLYQYVPVIYRDINQPFKQEYRDSEFVRKCTDLAYFYNINDFFNTKVDQRMSVIRRMDYTFKKMGSLSIKSV